MIALIASACGRGPSSSGPASGFYRDVAVVAFPSPAKGPLVSDIDEKALYVRAPYSAQPGVKPFLPSPPKFPGLPAGAAIDPDRIVDLADKLMPDGRLVWNVPAGRWTILRFGRTTTGAKIRVANLWPNRLIGDEREPPDADYAQGGNLARWPEWIVQGKPRPSPGRLTFSTWKHYDRDSPLLPSGLLGPVRLLSTRN